MKMPILIFLYSFSSLLFNGKSTEKMSLFSQKNRASKKDMYQLVWSDEFNKDGPVDTTNWQFEKGFLRNKELQWYQKENARCEKGYLIIEGRNEQKPNPVYKEGSTKWPNSKQNIKYTSSSINTSGKHSWKYGRFVLRARINTSEGLWPAWWTLGIKGQWPSNGEIDIMEFYQHKLLANIACATAVPFKPEWFTKTKSIDSFGDKKWSSKFHTWRMDWDENSIALYVDDMEMNKVELSKLVNKDGTNSNPFNQPHYMLLNLAIGGDNGGDPSQTKFPNRFEIDYVRVYQKQP